MRGDFTRLTHDPRKHYRGVLMQQGRVQLDADWNENLAIAGRVLRTITTDVIGGCGVPLAVDAFRIGAPTAASPAAADFTISAGRMYVDGLLCELDNDTTYLTQPDYLDPVGLGVDSLKVGETRRDLVYIDAWHRAISAIEDPHIREKALGGPDTGARLQLLAQVKVLPNIGADVTCKSPFPLGVTGGGQLKVVLTPTPSPPAPCEPLAEGGYQGPDNRLYRVEIHAGGSLGIATFKWSRDNGSVAQAVERFTSTTRLRVASLGRDDYLKFRTGDFVEVSDDATELAGEPGVLTQITVDEASRELTLATAVPTAMSGASGRHPKVRRWDGGDAQPTGAGAIDLEDGLQVAFSSSPAEVFRSGDYWIFAARVVDGSLDPLLDTPTPPMGIRHAYCTLAIITWRRSNRNQVVGTVDDDCRLRFPPLTQLPTGGGGCECVACVTTESHASGQLTIQAAIDQAKQFGGGAICLGPGDYELKDTLRIWGARNIHLRGQGQLTRLLFQAANRGQAAVDFSNSCDCSLERVAVLFGGVGLGVSIANCVDATVRGCILLSRADQKQPAAGGVAVQLVQSVLNTRIVDNLVIAETGVGLLVNADTSGATTVVAAGPGSLLLAQTEIVGNRFACAGAGVSLMGSAVFVFRTLRIADNQFDQCSSAGVVIQGVVGPTALVQVDNNVFETLGYGLALECGRTRVSGNLFTSLSTLQIQASVSRRQAAILLFDSTGLELTHDILISSNRIAEGRGHGILVDCQARDLQVSHNRFQRLGGGGVITGQGGSVEALTVLANDFSDLALDRSQFAEGLAGAVVLNLASDSRVLANTIARIGAAIEGVRVVGIAVLGSSEVLIEGNALRDIGGPQNGLPGAGIEASGVVSELTVVHNTVRRTGEVPPQPLLSPWYALRIAGADTSLVTGQPAPTKDFFTLGRSAFALVRQQGSVTPPPDVPQFEQAVATPNRLLAIVAPLQPADQFAAKSIIVNAIPAARAAASVADNSFESSGSTPVVDCAGVSELVFSGNRSHFNGETAVAVRLEASRMLVLANNTVDGSRYGTSIEVPKVQGLTVVGNIVNQPMAGVPPVWGPLNVLI